MNQFNATIVYVTGIIGLFYLDRDAKVRTSRALWIPVAWLLITGSRPVSVWLGLGPAVSLEKLYEDGSPIDAAVYGGLIAAGLLVLSLRSHQVRKFLRGNAPLLLFLGYCGLSIVWSDYSLVSLKRWVKAFGDPVMILVVLTDPNPLGATKRFFSRAGFLLLPLSVLLNKYYPDVSRGYSMSWDSLYNGVTETKNELGEICLVCGLGSLWSFLGAYQDRQMPHRTRHLSAHGIVVATAIYLWVVCNSMTSLSCFLMGGAVMFLTTWRYFIKHPRAMHVLVGGSVALSSFALFFDTSGSLVSSLGRNTTLTGRTDIWKAVLAVHTNPLVGTGFESFWIGNRLERVDAILGQPGIQEAHNGYLELYLNLGFLGAALLAILIVTGYRNVLAALRRDPHCGRLRLAFFTAGVIYSLTEAGFRMMSPIWIAFLLAVTFVPPNVQRKKRQLAPGSNARQSVTPAGSEVVLPEAV